MYWLGAQRWNLCRQINCRERGQVDLKDQFWTIQWLRQLTNDDSSMRALRSFLSSENGWSGPIYRMSDREVIDQVADLLSRGVAHIHNLPDRAAASFSGAGTMSSTGNDTTEETPSSRTEETPVRPSQTRQQVNPAAAQQAASLMTGAEGRTSTAPIEGTTPDAKAPAPPDTCRGNPLHQQEEPMSCVLASSRMLIEQMTGADPGEAALRTEAEAAGWYDPINGSDPWQIPALLKAHGIANAEARKGMSLDDLEAATAAGQPAMVGFKNPGHRIIVDGVRKNLDGSKTVLVRDPGPAGAKGCRELTAGQFLDRYNANAPVIQFK